MTRLARYLVSLEAQTAQYQRKLDQANRRLERFDRRNRNALRRLRRGFLRLRNVLAAGFFAVFLRANLRAIDEIGKLQARLGDATEAWSEYRLVADRAGIRFSVLSIGLQRLQRRVAEAAVGQGEAQDALRELGLEAEALSRLPITQQFERVADQLSLVSKESDRTRLAFKLFDSEGVALLQTMENGAAGIRQVREEAQQLGLSLDRDAVDKAVAAQDALTNLSGVLQGLAERFLITLTPAIRATSDALVDLFNLSLEEQIASIDSELRGLGQALRENLVSPAEREAVLDRAFGLQRERAQLIGQLRRIRIETDGIAEIDISGNIERAKRKLDEFNASFNKVNAEAGRFERFLADQRFDRIIDELNESFRALGETINEQERALRDAEAAGQELGLTFTSAFEDAIVEGNKLRDVLRGLLKDIARIVIRRAVTEPLADFFSGIFKPKPRQFGGSVAPGRPFLVGERGPELFVPATAGNVQPSSALGGDVFNISVDARTTDEKNRAFELELAVTEAVTRVVNLRKKGRL